MSKDIQEAEWIFIWAEDEILGAVRVQMIMEAVGKFL